MLLEQQALSFALYCELVTEVKGSTTVLQLCLYRPDLVVPFSELCYFSHTSHKTAVSEYSTTFLLTYQEHPSLAKASRFHPFAGQDWPNRCSVNVKSVWSLLFWYPAPRTVRNRGYFRNIKILLQKVSTTEVHQGNSLFSFFNMKHGTPNVVSIFVTLVCISIMRAVFAPFPPAPESCTTNVFEKLCSKATCPLC